MPTASEFLRAIEADFDDDTPRLVYADWLDEHGDPERAEFIRLQCEAARLRERRDKVLPSRSDRLRYDELTAEATWLLHKHQDEWTAGLPKWAKTGHHFSRGFAVVHRPTGQQLATDGYRLRAATPFGGVVSLGELRGWVRSWERVLGSEHLAGVTDLSLQHTRLTDRGIDVLAASPHLIRLHTLDVGWGSYLHRDAPRLTDASARALAADTLPALRCLYVAGQPGLTSAGLEALLHSPHRHGLVGLYLAGGERTAGGPAFAELFRSPGFKITRLERLAVGVRRLGDAGAAVLADCPALAGLTLLDVTGNDLTDDGPLALLASPHLRNLEELNLSSNPAITDRTAHAVLEYGHPGLYLELAGTSVSNALQEAIDHRLHINQ